MFEVRGSRSKSVERSAQNFELRTSNGASLLFATRWGWMGLSASAKGVSAIVLPKSSRRAVERALARRPGSKFDVRSSSRATENKKASSFPKPRTSNLEPILREAQRQVLAYLSGKQRTLDFPIDLSAGTAFQRRVWQTALRIPYGRARSYQWIASKVGGTRHSRAVGNALGANPVPLIVPCHRVVAKDASLGGFSGGLTVKRKLLDLEGTLAQLRRKA